MSAELVAQTWAFRHDVGGDVKPEPAGRKDHSVQSPFRKPSLWICGFFYLVYQGVEGKLRKFRPKHVQLD